MSTVDPEQHAELIALRRAANAAHAELLAFNPRGPDTEEQRAERHRLREAAGVASGAVFKAMHDSGLVAEHGYHQVNVDLRNAAR